MSIGAHTHGGRWRERGSQHTQSKRTNSAHWPNTIFGVDFVRNVKSTDTIAIAWWQRQHSNSIIFAFNCYVFCVIYTLAYLNIVYAKLDFSVFHRLMFSFLFTFILLIFFVAYLIIVIGLVGFFFLLTALK